MTPLSDKDEAVKAREEAYTEHVNIIYIHTG